VTNQPRHPQSSPHPRRPPPAARRAPAFLGTLLLPLAAPAAAAAPRPTEPPAGPPPPPPAGPTPGLPLWAVLVIVGGTITLAAATTLITLALHPGHRCKPPPSARATHQPPPAARPDAREHTSTATLPTLQHCPSRWPGTSGPG